MEDTLRALPVTLVMIYGYVLILVLMEDTLRGIKKVRVEDPKSLNPCFNGRYSQSLTVEQFKTATGVS